MTSEYHLPEISVDYLLERIGNSATVNVQASPAPISQPRESLAVSLDINLSGTQDLMSYIQRLLETAELRGEIRTDWPDKLNRFPFIIFKPLGAIFLFLLKLLFNDQREVNFNLTESLKQSLKLNQELLQQITTLRSQVHTDLQRFNQYSTEFEYQWKTSVSQIQSQIQVVKDYCDARFSNTELRLDHTQQRLDYTERHLTNLEIRLDHTQQRLTNSEMRLDHTQQRLTDSELRLDHTERRLDLGEIKYRGFEEGFQAIDKRNFRDINFLKNDLVQQKKLITLLLERGENNASNLPGAEQVKVVTEQDHALDAFYTAFEDEFRGTREEITDRFRVYLPLIETAKNGSSEFPILDVGCGRGEWLELLRQSQHLAQGIDLNRVMIEECCQRGLDVREADVISYLKGLPEGSLAGVTGFHIIEHLPFPELIALFDETLRVLRPGGLVIFETPNPQNLAVGSYNFYFDPTHRNPLPSPLIKFVAEFRGFEKVQVMNLHPCPETLRITGSELAERFSDYFYGPQDYAVIGYKP